MTLYKITRPDGAACHGGSGRWHLPAGGNPGEWMPPVEVHICESGYHLIEPASLLDWLLEPATIWEAKGRGECQRQDFKIAYEEARLLRPVGLLTPRSLRLAAAEAAARAAEAAWAAERDWQVTRLLHHAAAEMEQPA